MMIVGILALVVGLGIGGFAFWQWRKLTMIGGAPLVKTGQLVGNASEKGLISVEGAIQTPEPLIAPCSGRSCLYYEIVVQQRWEKRVSTSNGSNKVTGKKKIKGENVGARFYIDDGSGPAKVDASEAKVNSKLEKSFEQEGNSSGHLTFGNYSVNVPPYSGDGWGTGSICVEKIVPADGNAYVAGRLEGDTIMKKGNMGGRLLIAREGLEALQKATKTKAVAAAVGAAVLVLGGGVTAAMSDSPGGSEALTISPGFTPDPMTASGLSGGMTEASTITGGAAGCVGTAGTTPDFVVTSTGAFEMLHWMVKSPGADTDTTIMVRQPDGTFICNDDFDGYNPMVSAPGVAGEYQVWVGSYSSGEHLPYTFGVSQLATATPATL